MKKNLNSSILALILVLSILLTTFSCQWPSSKTKAIEGEETAIPESYGPGPAWAKPVGTSSSKFKSTSPVKVENTRFVSRVLQEIEEEQYRQSRKSPSAIKSVEEDMKALRASRSLKKIDEDASKIIDNAAINYSKRVGVTFGDSISIRVNQ